MQLIVVNGFSYALSDMSDPTTTAVITLTGVPSLKNKVSGNGICYDGFTVVITNIVTATATIPDPGPKNASFQATATKVKGLDVGSKLVLRVNDKTGLISATPNIPGPTPEPITFKVQITNSGQTKVLSN